MASTANNEPSQAERLEAVAEATVAGPGATDKTVAGDPFSEKPANRSSSDSSEAVAKEDGGEKAQEKPEAPQRSAGQIALIMASLCVSDAQARLGERHFADQSLDCRLSCCARYCQSS